MNIIDGEIVIGKSISNVFIGMSLDSFINIYGKNYEKVNMVNCIKICLENAIVWIDKNTNCIYQITVFGNFNGKIYGKIGIGDNLSDVKKFLGEYIDNKGVYELRSKKGICFELEDLEEWNEIENPIQYISVYDPERIE